MAYETKKKKILTAYSRARVALLLSVRDNLTIYQNSILFNKKVPFVFFPSCELRTQCLHVKYSNGSVFRIAEIWRFRFLMPQKESTTLFILFIIHHKSWRNFFRSGNDEEGSTHNEKRMTKCNRQLMTCKRKR